MRANNVRELSEYIDKEDEVLLYCDFLDRFYAANSADKEDMIKTAPAYSEKNRLFLCKLAAAVELLSKRYKITIPEWVFDDKYFYPEIVYAFDTKNIEFQNYLIKTSYDEYMKRNLYMGDTVLKRA